MLPLILLLGPTASGKTALALALARHLADYAQPTEILSCDSVAVYRHMQLGTAKPTPAERTLVPHHLLDLYDPTEACTAGDYARHARTVLAKLAARNTLPIIAGGTGLYARALLDGLFPSPPANPALRALLRRRDPARLHRTLARFDPAAATLIHPNDAPKLIRAIEVSLAAPGRSYGAGPITQQWTAGRDTLAGYTILRLTLQPPRPLLYVRIDQRAAAMFSNGLVAETRSLIARFGPQCRPFTSLGYAQAAAVLSGTLTEAAAVAATQQGHRNYSKRQQTWFRREAELHPTHILQGYGDSPTIQQQASALAAAHLSESSLDPTRVQLPV